MRMNDLTPMVIRFETAFGHAAMAYHSEPFSLVEILLPRPTVAGLDERVEAAGWKSTPKPHPLARDAAALMIAYFTGRRTAPPWQWMDLGRFTPAQASVFKAVADIPYGRLRSYGEIAATVNRPRGARFVGQCMAANPYPVFIPCHRVVRSDGTLGGFGGGIDLKRRMLALEQESGPGD